MQDVSKRETTTERFLDAGVYEIAGVDDYALQMHIGMLKH